MTTVWFMSIQVRKLATATISRCLQLQMPPMNGSRRTIPRELLLDKYEVSGDETRPRSYCPICGALIDMRDLSRLLAHVHDAEIEIGEGQEPSRREAPVH
jgi:hypothetical protein